MVISVWGDITDALFTSAITQIIFERYTFNMHLHVDMINLFRF